MEIFHEVSIQPEVFQKWFKTKKVANEYLDLPILFRNYGARFGLQWDYILIQSCAWTDFFTKWDLSELSPYFSYATAPKSQDSAVLRMMEFFDKTRFKYQTFSDLECLFKSDSVAKTAFLQRTKELWEEYSLPKGK